MMKVALVIPILFLFYSGFSQLVPDKSIHDFQLIFEEDSTVSHVFKLENTGKSPLRITAITPSCGCTVAELSETALKPGQISFLKASYNPEGRPGNFIKSIQLQYEMNGEISETYVVLKGFTKKKAAAFKENFTLDSLFILPYEQEVIYADHWVLNQQNLNRFVNDLTYAIDYRQIANVQFQIYTHLGPEKLTPEISRVKRELYRLLEKRNYPSYHLAFMEEVFLDSILPDNKAAYIKIKLPLYYKNNLRETLIFESSPKSVIEKEEKQDLPIIAYCFADKKAVDFKVKKEEFVSKVTRSALGEHPLILGGIYYSQSHTSKKELNKQLKKVKKEVIKNGIPETKFLRDTILSVQGKGQNMLCEFVPYFYENELDEKYRLKVFDEDFFVFEENLKTDKRNIQNLPAHFQQIKDYVQDLDTTNSFFISMMEKVISSIKNGKTVEFNIESSASKAPTDLLKASNDYVARMRAEEAQKRIRNYLKNRGIREEDIHFGRSISLVTGPEYDLNQYLIQYYYYFQYLKVIPAIKNESFQAGFIAPYKVNFSGNDLELATESAIFQKFMDKLAEIILTQGYVRLIIESSSSKVPVLKMRKNVHLSYHRAQEAKNQVYNEMKKRGINPTKIIFVEELILVQGPDFDKRKDDPKDPKFEPFQYVKIVPFSNIEER